MVRKTTTRRKSAKTTALVDASASKAETRSSNPMDWLYDNPLGSYPDFTFGILEQTYRGFANTPSEFCLRKLRPVDGLEHEGSFDEATFTAYRYGTVLPEDALDVFDSAGPLLKGFDLSVSPNQPAVLIYVTMAFPEARRLHHAWEESRAFAFENFAQKRQLPVLIVQHRPGDAGSDNPVHTHLLVSARRVDGTGYRGFASELLCDYGQRIVYEEWCDFRAKWQQRFSH